MRLRTSAILALSALSLGACISQPNSASTGSQSPESINPLVKDYIYYFEHLNEAKTKNEQCLKDDVFKKAGINDITVTNTAINQLPKDAQLVITQKKLTDRAIKQTPNAIHISVDNFLNSPRYEELLNNLKKDDQA